MQELQISLRWLELVLFPFYTHQKKNDCMQEPLASQVYILNNYKNNSSNTIVIASKRHVVKHLLHCDIDAVSNEIKWN